MRRLPNLQERGSAAATRSVTMREIDPQHGRDLGIRSDATTGAWGPEQGREFDVRFHGIRFDIPDEAREKLGERGVQDEFDAIVEYHLEEFIRELKAKHKWVGKVGLVGRGPGWLVVEDASRGEDADERAWDAVHKTVEKAFSALVADINSPDTWKEVLSARAESREPQRLGERAAPKATDGSANLASVVSAADDAIDGVDLAIGKLLDATRILMKATEGTPQARDAFAFANIVDNLGGTLGDVDDAIGGLRAAARP